MRAFTRSPRPSKELAPLQKPGITWDDYMRLHKAEHDSLSKILWVMQDFFCAYCERVINFKVDACYGDGHIEHLERRCDNPARIGDWSNLFFSCNDCQSCGHYKDERAGAFNVADIIDPSKEDPAKYFSYDSNGGVSPIEADQFHPKKAQETIRVFNLDKAPSLRAVRKGIAETVFQYIENNGGQVTEKERDDFLHKVQSQDCPSVYAAYFNMSGRVVKE